MLIISIEGLDGVGKTTQATNLCTWFRNLGKTAEIFSVSPKALPRNRTKDFTKSIIEIVNSNGDRITAATQLFLYCAAIKESLHKAANLRRPEILIADRWAFSTRAYYQALQHTQLDSSGAKPLAEDTVSDIINNAYLNLQPSLIFHLHLPESQCMARLSARPNKDDIEQTSEVFYRQAKILFSQMYGEAYLSGVAIKRIDAAKSEAVVLEEMIKTVCDRLNLHSNKAF